MEGTVVRKNSMFAPNNVDTNQIEFYGLMNSFQILPVYFEVMMVVS